MIKKINKKLEISLNCDILLKKNHYILIKEGDMIPLGIINKENDLRKF